MADPKTLKTRIALLYKSYAEWSAVAETYVPLKGEVCFCDIPASTGVATNEPCVMFKVGNGVTTLANLPWASAYAADIYAWAKKENLDFIDLDETFKAKLLEYIQSKVVTTDTKYRIVLDSASNWRWKLQKSLDEITWTDAEGLIDLTAIIARLDDIDIQLADIKAMTKQEIDEVITK